MMLRLATLVAVVLSVGACHASLVPPPEDVGGTMPPCAESEENGCENGKPLCMASTKDACRICRCTEYHRLASDAPSVAATHAGPGGMAPLTYAARP
jgi:hypothetical protein